MPKILKKLHRSKLSEKLQGIIKKRFDDSVGEIEELEGGGVMLHLTKPEKRMGDQATVFPICERSLSEEQRAAALSAAENTVEFSFSSEYPVRNWWGEEEILSHHKDDADFDRFREVGAVLYNHNHNLITGKPLEVWLDDQARMGMCREEFGSTDIALQAKHEVLVDGSLRGISCGFVVNAWVWLENEAASYRDIKGKEGGLWVAAKWQALESSHTPIPADPTSKVGRHAGGSEPDNPDEGKRQEPKPDNSEERKEDMNRKERALKLGLPEDASWDQIIEKERELASKEIEERNQKDADRRGEIMAIAKSFGLEEDGKRYADEGKTTEDFKSYVISRVQDGSAKPPEDPGSEGKREMSKFSFTKFLREAMSDPNGGQLTGIEREMHEEAQKEARESGAAIEGCGIPLVLLRATSLTAGAATGGAEFVPESMGSMIDALTNRTLVAKAGANVMPGLSANVVMPRFVTNPTAESLAENGDGNDATIVTGELNMSPKRVHCSLPISKQLITQNPQVGEAKVRQLLTNAVNLRIDYLALHGSGSSNEPTGLFGTTGVGSVAGGTDGAAPTRDHLVDLMTEVSVDNADMGALGFFTNAKVRGKLQKTKTDAGSGLFVWPESGDKLLGFDAYVSNQVRSDLDKGASSGVCSAIAYGDWSQLDIGLFGGLDVVVDPYALKKKFMLEITVNALMDIAVEQPQAFAVMLDALTT